MQQLMNSAAVLVPYSYKDQQQKQQHQHLAAGNTAEMR
jgi:hypothetical protein